MDTSVLEQLGASEAVEIDTEHGNRKIWLLKVCVSWQQVVDPAAHHWEA